MRFLRNLVDLLHGGADERLRRLRTRLERLLSLGENSEECISRAARFYRKTLRLALRARPQEAFMIHAEYDSEIHTDKYHLAFSERDSRWVFSLSRSDDPCVLSVSMRLAERLSLDRIMRTAAERLAVIHARMGHADVLISHLRSCHQLGLPNRPLLEAVLPVYLSGHSFEESSNWKAFLLEQPAEDLPELFEVKIALGLCLEAANLAMNDGQRRKALACCMASDRYEDTTAALALAEALSDVETAKSAHARIGDHLLAKKQFAEALEHCTKGEYELGISRAHEGLGDFIQAFMTCPLDMHERLMDLVSPFKKGVLALAQQERYTDSLRQLSEAIRRLRAAALGDAVEKPHMSALEDCRIHILERARRFFEHRASQAPELERQVRLLEWSDMEEAAGETAEAARLAESAGDSLRAAHLWESDEKYGEALRVLGPHADSDEVLGRMAQLMERGGDLRSAAMIYERLGRLEDATRAYESRQEYAAAARCFRKRLGDEGAAASDHFADLLIRAGKADELATICIAVVRDRGVDTKAGQRLQDLLAESGPAGISVAVRSEGQELLGRLRLKDRKIFEKSVGSWIKKARKDVLHRYAPAWGMDLGTTNCAAALYDIQERRPFVCPVGTNRQFASILAIDSQGREIVGMAPEELLNSSIVAGIVRSKRHMGTATIFRAGGKHIRPEEVAARLIGHARGVVEGFLREKIRQGVLALAREDLDRVPNEWVHECTPDERLDVSLHQVVVTVPAYFGYKQKQATRDACNIAGIELLRLLPEPTAACLATGETRKLEGRIATVDLGAGTLDISLLDVGEKVYDVTEVHGDCAFGSSDFDDIVFAHLADILSRGHGVPAPPGGILKRRLMLAAEQLKIALSSQEHASYVLRGVDGAKEVSLELSRQELSQMLEKRMKTLADTCKRVTGGKLDHLLLVGAPMLSPMVRETVEKAFGQKGITTADPRTAVACGAAVQAAVLTGNAEAVLLDIVPFSLSVRTHDPASGTDHSHVHIDKSTTIPTNCRHPYTTTQDNQQIIKVEVLQGEADAPRDNVEIGQFELRGIPPAAAGVPKIEVTFDIDANGVLTVTAKDTGTGNENSIRIEDTTMLTPEERRRMRADFDVVRAKDQNRQEVESLIHTIRQDLEKANRLSPEAAIAICRRHLETHRKAMAQYDLTPAEEKALYDIFNQSVSSENATTLALDQLANLQNAFEGISAQIQTRWRDLEASSVEALVARARDIKQQLRELTQRLGQIRAKYDSWNALLGSLSGRITDPAERFLACHEAEEYETAAEAFRSIPYLPSDVLMLERYLDCLAHTQDRSNYRHLLLEGPSELGAMRLEFERLNVFCKKVLPSVAWIQVNAAGALGGSASGFMISGDLVATNRHVVTLGKTGGPVVKPEQLSLHLTGAWRTVSDVILPPKEDLDLALLRLTEPCDVRPLRIGYADMTELGERVLAIGFPCSEGDQFEQNVLVDDGLINRIRYLPESEVRVFEIGIRGNPGMSGGPVFNDLGEVVGLVSFARRYFLPPDAEEAFPRIFESCHAIAADPLREMAG